MPPSNIIGVTLVAALFGTGCIARDGSSAQPVITLEPAIRFQTMVGWEATAQAGQEEPGSSRYLDTVLALAVNEIGINRLRLEVRSGAENSIDYWSAMRTGRIDYKTWRCARYPTVNDDADPQHITEAGFHWTDLDSKVEQVVLPVKRRMEANGEKLYLNLNYVSFMKRGLCAGHAYGHNDPEEYAEFVLAAVTHLRTKYGLVPDALEVALEPENNIHWQDGAVLGRAIVAATRRLRAAGFNLDIIAPSTTKMSNAVKYLEDLARVPGALELVTELSYHRYSGVSEKNLRAIATEAGKHGLRTAMLEHIGSGHEDLHDDLEIGMNSAWQQYTLAFPGSPTEPTRSGGSYITLETSDTLRPVVRIAEQTKFLRQYFRFVRRNAVRIGAASDDDRFRPLAFINSDSAFVVVVKASAGGTLSIKGLPIGMYGVSFATADSSGAVEPARVAGTTFSASIPAAGVITIYQRSDVVQRSEGKM
ncbi:MAG: hypothetical protein H7Z74_14705 [Anaerolineae bacterium]|nr:hypothetical protein [Gemmatimonadaceae bacterium]